MDSQKIVCYANLNSFNSPREITDDHMDKFFRAYYQESNVEILDVIVDHSKDATALQNRKGWNKAKYLCKEKKVDYIVVPSLNMLGSAVGDLFSLSKELDYKYGTAISIIYEDITGKEDRFRHLVEFQTTLLYNQEMLKKTARKMREIFYKATGLEGEGSAERIPIEYDLYRKAEAKAKEYGDSVDTLVRYLLQFATDPANEATVDQYVYGVEPQKVRRGRPKKQA